MALFICSYNNTTTYYTNNHQGKDVAHKLDATPVSAKWGVGGAMAEGRYPLATIKLSARRRIRPSRNFGAI